ncbi:3-oxoacyl-ACP reductase [Marinobacterium nitratireducens]|uniref:3-oxoacyl-ACP reductase n=1 Tax=Marinobacterium nitratireducens TaxID=518897 RepID=A0A917ZIX0_9GAMM|nr:glucose 1-dehydrogenase [Marinobacterium nitratireducens]GGO84309.1 3-oxoacyl-ACP reductase [Marinobacterium nitratireducens]
MQYPHFADQVVLITGAASGFGRLLAEKLAPSGARLILADLNEGGLDRLAASLSAAGAPVLAMACDVTSQAQVKALHEAAIERFGRLDIAINNAGRASAMKALIDTEEAELDQAFAVNAKGVFFGMKYQIRQMLTQGHGCILNVASLAGIGGAPKLAAYCAAKHAVVGLTRTAAVEYAAKNIRVNAICPFFSPTPLVTNSDMDEKQAFLAQGSPMKRLGSPEEIVNAMLAICNPDNSYMTGQAIAVDGGVSAF